MTVAVGTSPPSCSFCGEPRTEQRHLVSARDAHICDGCVDECVAEIVERRAARGADGEDVSLPRPREIGALLDRYVVDQHRAKRSLAVSVYNHYKRNLPGRAAPGGDDVELVKSNILLLGPTGSGKTLLAQTLARILRVPFTIVDATGLTEAGYVGDDVDSVLLKLLQAAGGDIRRAQMGIVYIDEIDKIARRGGGAAHGSRDVSGEGVQQSLLKIIEGAVTTVVPRERGGNLSRGSRSRTAQEGIQLDTSDILFIVAGAFAGIEDIVEKRLGAGGIGFAGDRRQRVRRTASELVAEVGPEDLVEFGMIPEFVGRLPMITSVDHLGRAALLRVLTEPRNALVRQYRRLFEIDGIELEFGPGALEAVADQAIERGTGARGLRSILDNVLISVMYDVPSLAGVARVVVTERTITQAGAPELYSADGEVHPYDEVAPA
ncbi:ATP-dependent Clp protease ATP-binding subunit ClpX [Actinokineospora globicatena]|uniref:ATP-dependent Clp protease ATP-binding subunit ClpX n=1 Tax=Actinokineospora globicatena TaxID=103729 RepID=UPI0020A53A11|nr:ATP-dependent Clp protease ATP-binding subunit ClpX [Actinokineospora globicatena]MCP2303917.1 ATP-dependent Clp protease ATP-binding subunit ClpX [Actinokineospora globicatena]GLW78923.1 ATP-dependent Clp protease ATP-binding subunit ClpX [Actinokineospora globicatena]GLW86665.1 ATP-dependent Clp protease ATP-binding subunit ClpX [Actinokineospora globicatena]